MDTDVQRLTPPPRLAPLFAVAVLLAAGQAAAQGLIPRDEGFMKPPSSVQNRLYSLDGKNDFGAFFAFSIKNRLTEHYGATLQWNRAFSEYLALDVMVGGGYGGLTNLAKTVRTTARLTGNGDDLEDAGALLAHGSLGLRFTPAYGKISLSSEIPVHFHAYFVGGVGGALVNYNGILSCAQALTNNRCQGDNFRSETKPTLSFNVGLGFRFLINQTISARVEMRDVMYLDRWYQNVNLRNPTGAGAGEAQSSGLTHAPLIMLGMGFLL